MVVTDEEGISLQLHVYVYKGFAWAAVYMTSCIYACPRSGPMYTAQILSNAWNMMILMSMIWNRMIYMLIMIMEYDDLGLYYTGMRPKTNV